MRLVCEPADLSAGSQWYENLPAGISAKVSPELFTQMDLGFVSIFLQGDGGGVRGDAPSI